MDYSSITETINSSINSLYTSLIDSFDSKTFSILDNITFIDTSVLDNKYFSSFLDYNSNSIIYIVNAFLVAFLLYYIILFFSSRFTGNSVENPLHFLLKLTVCSICVNFSYFICEQIIYIIDLITNIVREYAFSIFSVNISFSYLSEQLSQIYTFNQNTLFFSYDGMIRLFINLGCFNLLFTYSYRYILVKLLILLSPFFLLSACLNSTKWLFKMWLKNFLSLLSIQIVVSIIMMVILSIKYSFSDETIKILYIGSLYALMKASSFIKDFSSGFTTDITSGISNIKNTIA